MKAEFLVFIGLLCLVQANKKVSDFVPDALKKHLPANVISQLNKLGPKDLQAAGRVASKWSEFKSVQQFEKVLLVESRPLKAFIDSAIHAGHDALDQTVDKFHPETIKMIQQASRIVAKAGQELQALYANGHMKARENLQDVFPKASFFMSHPQARVAAVNYCGLFNGLLGGNGGAGLTGLLGGGLNGGLGGNFGLGAGLNSALNRRGRLGRGYRLLWG